MTTETRARPACLMNVCEARWYPKTSLRPCGERADAPIHRGDTSLQPHHEFVGHTHSVECSAAFYRDFLGVEHVADGYGATYMSWESEDTSEGFWARVPDIIASPGTDEARLAMFDVIEEMERRGFTLSILNEAGGTWVHFGGNGLPAVTAFPPEDHDGWMNWDDVPDGGPLADIPAAVALAAWAASLEEGRHDS